MLYHDGKIDATCHEVGYRPEKIDELDRHFETLIEKKELLCAGYILSKNSRVFAHRTMGTLNALEEKGDFQPNSIRRIASLTKLFTAVAILQLIEKGQIYLEQSVGDLIEEFKTPMHEKISIFHLLTHTSGMTADAGYFKEPYPARWWHPDEAHANWIQTLLEGPLQAKPGVQWNYCSRGFMVLGEIIARVSGIPYAQYVHDHILRPLEMERSFFTIPKELHDDVCIVNSDEQQHLEPDHDIGEDRFWIPAGGLYSTLHDMWKFAQMFLNRGVFNGHYILSKKSVDAMTRNYFTNIPAYYWGQEIHDMHYGLEWALGKDPYLPPETFSREGAGRSALYVDPTDQFIAVYYVPTHIHWHPESMINTRGIIWSGIL